MQNAVRVRSIPTRKTRFGPPLLGMAAACLLLAGGAAAETNHLNGLPTHLSVTNTTADPVYLNLILGQTPTTNPPNCSDLGMNITSLTDPKLVFVSSVPGKSVSFSGPPGVTTKGAYRMEAGETIKYLPQLSHCGEDGLCTPAMAGNMFFTKKVNGTTTGNNGCGGAGTDYPNATNLAEFSLNFGGNGSVGTGCANADDTDISIVNGVNATLEIVTTGSDWPAATSTAANKKLGENPNLPGVFGWAATNCTNTAGYPNPSASCAAPVNAPRPVNGTCPPPMTALTGPDGTQYCAETSAAGTCNNQRTGSVTGGKIAVSYKGAIPAYIDAPVPSGIFNNAAAQRICPGVCTTAKGTWSGQWTNIVSPNVCGCWFTY